MDGTDLLQENDIERVHVIRHQFVGRLIIYGVRYMFQNICSKLKYLE